MIQMPGTSDENYELRGLKKMNDLETSHRCFL